jgi:hypothetical protein
MLLMEGDFNTTNKIVYGSRMFQTARRHHLIPEVIFSEKNRMADDGTLCKTLFYNTTRQACVPAAIALVDASNCFDQIAHAMASLIFQAFGVPLKAVETMLGAIDNMKFFLRTGFGDSKSFAGGGISIKMQGLTQGNGASPAGWAVISICILGAHKKQGHGAKFVCPITKLLCHLTAILYVDDTDILHINLKKDERVNEVHNAIQSSVTPTKQMLLLSNILRMGEQRMEILVPLPGGKEEPIDHKSVDHAEKTIGAMTSPNGDSSASLALIKETAQTWINAVRNGPGSP